MSISHKFCEEFYDEEYFERGVQTGKSGYQNYCWMPELTLRMAHFLIREMGLDGSARVVDFGCAKGYLVKALRLLDIDAFGVDISKYAISSVEPALKNYCIHIESSSEPKLPFDAIDLLIAKDVFEHIPHRELPRLLRHLRGFSSRLFVAVPIAIDGSENFVVSQYHNDPSHVTIRDKGWWLNLVRDAGWTVDAESFTFPGMKENWTRAFPEGNLFVKCS